jgi:hypothetical protein
LPTTAFHQEPPDSEGAGTGVGAGSGAACGASAGGGGAGSVGGFFLKKLNMRDRSRKPQWGALKTRWKSR